MLVYIVEDSLDIIEVEKYALEGMGFEVQCFEHSKDFFDGIKKKKPDIVLLDIIVHDENGYDILDKMRKSIDTKNIPVIMVSSCDSEMDKTKGLDGGADDYIVKPFGLMEFMSRIKAIMRRANIDVSNDLVNIEGIQIDMQKREVTVEGEICNLTYKEYELLRYLALNKGIVLSRDKIMEYVWGFDFQGESRTVDMHVKTLRQKLKSQGTLIQTVRNVGYKML